MARPSESSRVKAWHKRLAAAEKVYEEWEKKYKVKKLEQFYLGHQWDDQPDPQREKIVVNLIFPSMEAKKPSLMFFRPQAVLTGRPSRSDDPGTSIESRAQIRQDTLNHWAGDPRVCFRQQTLLALHEAFFRFGLVEVGYTQTDWIDNPRAGRPMLKEDKSEMVDGGGQPVLEPARIPGEDGDEALYVRRIPACNVRFPASKPNNILSWNDWYAYCEWVPLEDVKRNPNYKNATKLKGGGKLQKDYDESSGDPKDEDKGDLVKLWKIFDLRSKTRIVLADNHDKFLQEKPISFAPHAMLKFYERLDEALPLPPVFNWLQTQIEQNEQREDLRTFRRGAYRRYLKDPGRLDDNEALKLETGGDGVYANTNGPPEGVIVEVPQGRLNEGVIRGMMVSKEDFNNITAVSSEQRNSAEAETATQAQIKHLQSNIRESFSRYQVAEWLSEIFRLMMRTIEENFTLPMVIKSNVDPTALGAQMEVVRIAQEWLKLTPDQMGTALEYDVSVDVESLSPASADTKKREFMDAMMNVFGNPTASMVLMFSPSLLKRMLDHLGMRSDQMLNEVREALAGMQLLMMGQQKGGPGGPGGPPGGGAEPGPTPDQQGIQGQLQAQMGGPVQ